MSKDKVILRHDDLLRDERGHVYRVGTVISKALNAGKNPVLAYVEALNARRELYYLKSVRLKDADANALYSIPVIRPGVVYVLEGEELKIGRDAGDTSHVFYPADNTPAPAPPSGAFLQRGSTYLASATASCGLTPKSKWRYLGLDSEVFNSNVKVYSFECIGACSGGPKALHVSADQTGFMEICRSFVREQKDSFLVSGREYHHTCGLDWAYVGIACRGLDLVHVFERELPAGGPVRIEYMVDLSQDSFKSSFSPVEVNNGD